MTDLEKELTECLMAHLAYEATVDQTKEPTVEEAQAYMDMIERSIRAVKKAKE